MNDGFGTSPVGRTPGGRTLDLLFMPPTPDQERRARRRGERLPTGGQMLCCRGSGEPLAEVQPVRDLLESRLRTGDGVFDAEVCVETREKLPWLVALDAPGREAIRRAVRQGWTCIGDDWVLPWDPEMELDPLLLSSVDAAIDALAPERTAGRQRWLAALRSDGRSLRRAQLVLRGAAAGWLPPEQARDLLAEERQPLVRLALFTLFLPETVAEVSSALRASDAELVGLAAVALAHTDPSGALREQVEKALLALIDTPLEGLLGALHKVGGPATLQALRHRTGPGGEWRGTRRDRGLELLEAMEAEVLARGAGQGGVSIAEASGGGLGLAEPPGGDPERG